MVLLSSSLLKFSPLFALPLHSPDSLPILTSSSPCLNNFSVMHLTLRPFLWLSSFSLHLFKENGSQAYLQWAFLTARHASSSVSWKLFLGYSLDTSNLTPIFLPLPTYLSQLITLRSSQAKSSGSSFSFPYFLLPKSVLISCSFHLLNMFSFSKSCCYVLSPLYSSG